MTAGTLVLIFFALALCGFALQHLPTAIGTLRHGRDKQRLNAFYDAGAAAGRPTSDIDDELALREALATLRRISSYKVLADPADWVRILDVEKAAAVDRMAVTRRDLARRLGKTLGELPYTHILYDDACRAVEALPIELRDFYLTPDRIAALQIVRPS